MMLITRSEPERRHSNYQGYREHTRNDFKRFCAYCFGHEDDFGGPDMFDQDHFHPTSKGGALNDPNNLYWSCKPCNQKYKRGKWPTVADKAQGFEYCDPCARDPYGNDYVEDNQGYLLQRSPTGEYTILHLRLNEREVVRQMRLSRQQMRQVHAETLANLKEAALSRNDVLGTQLEELISEYEQFLNVQFFWVGAIPPSMMLKAQRVIGALIKVV